MRLQINKTQTTFKCCLSLFKLLHSQYVNNYLEWFYDFFFSIGFIGLYGYIQIEVLKKQNDYGLIQDPNDFKNIIIGILTLEIVSAGALTMPTCIMEIKTSVLMKRIGSTPIKPWMFIITTFIYYFIVIIIVTLWMLFITFLFFGFLNFKVYSPNTKDGYETIKGMKLLFGNGYIQGNENIPTKYYGVSWPSFIFSLLSMNFVSIFIGLLNVSTSKSTASSSIKGSMIYFISLILSGMLFPLTFITSNKILNIFSYMTPFRYSNSLVVVSWLNGNIFDPFNIQKNIFDTSGLNEVDIILSFVIPLVIIFISIIVMIKFFKWNTR